MYIGEIIKEYRNIHNLSQRAFAAKTNLSPSYINTLEKIYHPKTKKPYAVTTDAAINIANAMNISTSELFTKLEGFQSVIVNTQLKDKIISTVNMMEENGLSQVKMIPLYEEITKEKDWKNKINGYIPLGIYPASYASSHFLFYYKMNPKEISHITKDELYLLIEENATIKDGDLVIAFLNHRLMIRKYKKLKNNLILLESPSSYFPCESIDIDLKKETLELIGKVKSYIGNIVK